jgi:hypothetical protein
VLFDVAENLTIPENSDRLATACVDSLSLPGAYKKEQKLK